MFDTNRTVFILGAGASWHYGYPTGEELVIRVIEKANLAADYCQKAINGTPTDRTYRPDIISRNSATGPSKLGMHKEWEFARAEFLELSNRLKAADPLVIDYFLGWNPQLEDVGKFCVAWVLLECEVVYLRGSRNHNRDGSGVNAKDNWYRFLVNKLVSGCADASSLRDNKVNFITFNYDVSLEAQLYKALSSLAQFEDCDNDNQSIRKFLGATRIIHVYGKLRVDPFTPPPSVDWFALHDRGQTPNDFWIRAKELFDTVYQASQGINIIAPHKMMSTPSDEILTARRAISDAKVVYVLGYGFDRFNSDLLHLPELLELDSNQDKRILFTNMGDSNRITTRAARLFRKSQSRDITQIEFEHGSGFATVSHRSVYDAFAVDFDDPDEVYGRIG